MPKFFLWVCETILSDSTYQRRVRPFKSVKDNCPKTILTSDRFRLGSDEGIKVLNPIVWLLDRKQ